ncbi:MAG: hypothetical protein H6906_00325 [Hyphomicrobiales bacterium]|nr:hypothetical protein [Hyphomicrobiales bacterium]
MGGSTATDRQPPVRASRRLAFLLPGGLALVAAVIAGLARMGWAPSLPDSVAASLPLLHGPLMVAGMFGTVIGLERAVALGRTWAFLAPALTGAGAIAAVIGLPSPMAAAVMAGGAAVLLAASLATVRRQPATHTVVLALGAAALVAGNLAWLAGLDMAAPVAWWMAFLVLTIAGERRELSRLRPLGPGPRAAFAALCAVLVLAVVAVTAEIEAAAPALGGSLVGLAAWMGRYDIARHTVRQRGLTRFIAVCLLSGFAWLGLGGLVLALPDASGFAYADDAGLHAVFLGFVFAMVFGHAPIILPAVTGLRVAYHPYFYVPLAILQVTLAGRLAADYWALDGLRLASGAGNAAALALFILGTALAAWRGTRQARAAAARK